MWQGSSNREDDDKAPGGGRGIVDDWLGIGTGFQCSSKGREKQSWKRMMTVAVMMTVVMMKKKRVYMTSMDGGGRKDG
jgi:hypothetical protein